MYIYMHVYVLLQLGSYRYILYTQCTLNLLVGFKPAKMLSSGTFQPRLVVWYLNSYTEVQCVVFEVLTVIGRVVV